MNLKRHFKYGEKARFVKEVYLIIFSYVVYDFTYILIFSRVVLKIMFWVDLTRGAENTVGLLRPSV